MLIVLITLVRPPRLILALLQGRGSDVVTLPAPNLDELRGAVASTLAVPAPEEVVRSGIGLGSGDGSGSGRTGPESGDEGHEFG